MNRRHRFGVKTGCDEYPTRKRARILAFTLGLFASAAFVAQGQTTKQNMPAGDRQSLVEAVERPAGLALGYLPGGPVFDPARPVPVAPANAEDIESLVVAPEGWTMQRRNNFYRPEGNTTEGLYRWAASGHWSNYDEAKLGDWKSKVPDLLTTRGGMKVTTPQEWKDIRRPEIIHLLEDAVFGRVPDTVPQVKWTKSSEVDNGDGTIAITAAGEFVNADGTPWENPNPPAARGGRAGGRGPAGGRAAGGRAGVGRGGGGGSGLSITYTIPVAASAEHPVGLMRGGGQRALALGLGTVQFQGQAPNVASNPPQPTDWGAIRRTTWPISRGIDFLELDPRVNARQIALTGASIGGKQALAAGVFDERIGLVFAAVSGEAGASMMKRDWGETIDDLAQLSPQNYCENFQKWVRNWGAMPVDAHMLLAAMAPRPVLVSGGSNDQWSDPVGIFWAAHYASPVYELLGEKGLGISEPPPLDTFVGDRLVFYYHDGGHAVLAPETDKYFEMAAKFFDKVDVVKTDAK